MAAQRALAVSAPLWSEGRGARVPEGWRRVIEKALALCPADRYRSAEALADAVRLAVSEQASLE
jgi:hypothetical protein